MKRYQCIKNIRHELFEFKAGSIYEFRVNPGGNFYGYTTPAGRIIWLKSSEIRAHFQELLDLHVDDIPRDPTGTYWEHDSQEYTLLTQPAGLGTGCAIVIVVFLTVLALIFFR